MIFKTIESDVNKSGLTLQLFKKNLSDIKNDFGNAKGIGGKLNSIFSSGLTDNDVKRIKEYNHLIEKGQNPQSAYYRALKNSSAAAQNLAQSANGATVSQKSMDTALKATSLSSKAAAVGMQALNVAMNVGIMLAVSAAINLVVTKLGEAKKASEDAAAAIGGLNDEVKSLDDLKKSMLDMRTELDKGNLSQADAYSKRQELMKIQDELIKKYGKEAEGIDFVTGSIKDQEEAIDNLARAEEQKWKETNQSAINDAKRYLTKTSNGKMTFDDQFNSLKFLKGCG